MPIGRTLPRNGIRPPSVRLVGSLIPSVAFEVSPGSSIALANEGGGNYTATRAGPTDEIALHSVRSVAAITGNFLLDCDILTMGAAYTQGVLGLIATQPTNQTYETGVAFSCFPAIDQFLYMKQPGDTAFANGTWSDRVFIERTGTTARFRTGSSYATSTVLGTITVTTGPLYAFLSMTDHLFSARLRFEAR